MPRATRILELNSSLNEKHPNWIVESSQTQDRILTHHGLNSDFGAFGVVGHLESRVVAARMILLLLCLELVDW